MSPGAEDQARVLTRSVEQRVFQRVFEAEQGLSGEAPQGAGGEDWRMLRDLSAPQGDPQAARSRFSAMDKQQIQAAIVAAYIKASALGSGQSLWSGPSLSGLSAVGPSPVAIPEAMDEEAPSVEPVPLGRLSSAFEAGQEGVAAVGYDRRGGTSYGIYQLSSKTGTMDRFLDFLRQREPQWAARLEAAGPADTGSRNGAMPRVWRRIARENPERFAALQHAFVRETHYEPAVRAVESATGIKVENLSRAAQEVLWSTAVQHGAKRAARFFSRALNRAVGKNGDVDEEALIRSIYRLRERTSRVFRGPVRDALLSRFSREKETALALLRGEPLDRLA